MSGNTPNATVAHRCLKVDNAFHVVIVYEDYAAGRSAVDTYQRLLAEFGTEFDFRISIWRFDVVESPKLMQHAVCDAVKADVIIVATHHDELPIPIKQWVDAWVAEKGGQPALLIALLNSEGGDADRPSRALEYLRKAAVSAGMDFLAQEMQSRRDRPTPDWRLSSQRASEPWGINE
jgi:hypothetical protein